MPDHIERLVDEWRGCIAAHLVGREDVLDELESHLYDELDRLVTSGLPPEAAFAQAAAKLGRPAEVAAEFGKVPPLVAPWLPVRLVWLQTMFLSSFLLWPLLPRLALGDIRSLLAAHMGLVTLGYVATLSIGCLALCFLLTRLFRPLAIGQLRSVKRAMVVLSALASLLTGLGMLLGSVCPFEKHGPFGGWSAHEVGGMLILAWDGLMFFLALRGIRQTSNTAALSSLGVIGNMTLIIGWLGAISLERQATPLVAIVLAALLLSQMLVACSVFVPAARFSGPSAS